MLSPLRQFHTLRSTAVRRHWRSTGRWIGLGALFGLAAWLLFRPGLDDFFWNDDLFWIDAARRAPGLASVVDALHTGGVYYYRPVVSLAFAIMHPAFDGSPEGYRLVNVGLHVANALLVVWLGHRLLGRAGWAALAAGLWLIYPTHPWTVWWISDIGGLLATFFSLVTLVCWDGHLSDGKRRRWWYLLAVVAFALALLSKEASLALIAVVPLWEARAPISSRGGWKRYIPFVAVWLLYLALAAWSLGQRPIVGAAYGPDYFLQPTRLKNLTSALFYVALPEMGLRTLPTRVWNVVGLGGWLAVLALFVRARGALRFIVAWMIAFLLPASALLGFSIPGSGRYLYPAAIGASLLLAYAIGVAAERKAPELKLRAERTKPRRGSISPKGFAFSARGAIPASLSVLLAALVLVVFAWRNVAQQGYILRPQPAYDMSRYVWSRVLGYGDAEAFLAETLAGYGEEEWREMEGWLAQPVDQGAKIVEDLLSRALAAERSGHREQSISLYNRVLARLEGMVIWDRRSRIGGIVLPADQVTRYARERLQALGASLWQD